MHGIKFVDDDQLPEGHDFVFVYTGDSAMIFYRRSAITPKVLEDSWAAYRATLGAPPPPAASEAAEKDPTVLTNDALREAIEEATALIQLRAVS